MKKQADNLTKHSTWSGVSVFIDIEQYPSIAKDLTDQHRKSAR